MQSVIINATPRSYDLGTEDLTTKTVPILSDTLNQFRPLILSYAEKGTEDRQLITVNQISELYGQQTLNPKSKYATHVTGLIEALFLQNSASVNSCVFKRIVPDDAGAPANILLGLDVVPALVDTYQRGTDGNYILDINGNPIPTGSTVNGYKIKWSTSYIADNVDIGQFGKAVPSQGTQVEAGVQSTFYPIIEFKTASRGEYGNNSGIKIWPQTKLKGYSNENVVTKNRVFPFSLSVMKRADANSQGKVVNTIYGEGGISFVFKPNTFDESTSSELFLEENFTNFYSNFVNASFGLKSPDFSDVHIYADILDSLLTMLFNAEVAAQVGIMNSNVDVNGNLITSDDNTTCPWSDFTTSIDDKWLFNFVNATTFSSVPYESVKFVLPTQPEDISSLNEYNTVWAKGGSDGTLSINNFNLAVEAELLRYLDFDDEVMDMDKNPETCFIDSGFPMFVKKAAGSLISQRTDTNIYIGTYVDELPDNGMLAQYSRGQVLKSYFAAFPESVKFGTPTSRATLISGSGKLLNGSYKKPLPLSVNVAQKFIKYCGAGDGRWKDRKSPDINPNNIITEFYDIQPTFMPNTIKNNYWAAGITYPEVYDKKSYFYAAYKTVYTDDTSVLNSSLTNVAVGTLHRMVHRVWKNFTGRNITNAQLVQQIDDYIRDQVTGIFDGRYVVIPATTITYDDALRGYSWTTVVQLYAPNMKTVQTTYVQAYRLDELNTNGV